MKTRIIKTRFWNDPKVMSLSFEARFVLIYLLTCPEINTIGCFEIEFRHISNKLGNLGRNYFKLSKIMQILSELEEKGLIVRQDSWIFVTKAPKHNRYWVAEKLQETVRGEIDEIPNPLRKIVIKALEDSTIDSTMDSTYKSKTINHKRGKRGLGEKRSYSENIADDVFEALVGEE